jgi:tRNA(Ile)-lysidine synthase
VVAVGHTRDDQAETVLLRLVRGAGSRGLTAIHPRRQHVIRPLIDLRRAELVTYLQSRGRAWRVDDSNQDRTRRRNRLRHDVLPALVASEGDSVIDVLARAADIAGADEALLAALTKDARARVIRTTALPLRLDLSALAEEPLALRRRVVQWALAETTGRSPSFAQVESALRFLARGRSGVLAVSGAEVELSAGQGVLLIRGPATIGPVTFEPWHYCLHIPGELAVPAAGFRLGARLEAVEVAGRDRRSAGRGEVVLDVSAVGTELTVRAWQPGDRMRLPGGSGRKKVQDLFVDGKVPRGNRHRVPIVTTADGVIVWVAGQQVAGGFGVTDATKSVVVLSFEPLGGNE